MFTCIVLLATIYQGQPTTVQDCSIKGKHIGRYMAVGLDHNIRVYPFHGQLVGYAEHKRQIDKLASDYLKQKEMRNKYE